MPISFVLSILGVCILLASCGGQSVPEVVIDLTPDEDNIIYITATPNPNVAANPTAEPQVVVAATDILPTPVPPTAAPPTQVPEELLATANRQLHNGYFNEAVNAYSTLLEQDTSDEIRGTAAFKLGQVSVRDGFFQSAVDALTLFITEFPNDSRIGQAYFLRGDAYLGLSEWNTAIADFEQYLQLRPGLIDSYAYERIGDAQVALGNLDAALAAFEQAVQSNRTIVATLALQERVAQILLTTGDLSGAVAQYDGILSVAQNPGYRSEIEYLAADALLSAGDVENGLARMSRVLSEYPNSSYAYLAMQRMLENGIEIEPLRQGEVAFNYGDYQGAIAAFNQYTTNANGTPVSAETYLLLGRAYREIGNSAAAQTSFQTIIDQYPQDPLFGDALLEQGRTYFLGNEIPKAIQTYLGIATSYNYLDETAAEALWRAAYLYGTNGNPTESREVFVQLADTYPDSEVATNGLLLAASAAVTDEQWDIAEELFGRLALIATGDDQAAAYLWVGRLALDRGDTAAANQAFEQATLAAPDSYFAARARDINDARQPFLPPTEYQFTFDVASDQVAAESWLRTTFEIDAAVDLPTLSTELATDPRMIRANELWEVAAYDEAVEEYSDILDTLRATDDIAGSYQMALYLRDVGAYLSAQVAAADIIRAAGLSTLEAPAFIARLRFPIYYLDVVLDAAQRRNIDPLLIFSLIRHESLFNTYATAAAGEKGLTQVIPGTAQYIADQLGWQNYKHSDLFRPYAGIEFGSFYLEEQLIRFDYNVMASLSGYNAGPGRAIDWLALSGGDPDLFMSTISIDSTRLYVQRIYGYHSIYRELYGTG